jgi:hypothetical protein
MPVPKNLVWEQSTSTGTGNKTLARYGGFARVSEAFGTGNAGSANPVLFFANKDATSAEWEVVQGYMSDANTFVPVTVLDSSNGGSAVTFTTGLKHVSNDIHAAYQVYNPNSTVTDGHAVVFDGTTGRQIKSAGFAAPNQNAVNSMSGRLTLTSGIAVLTSNVSGAGTIYYTPYVGSYIPIYDGTNFVPTVFSELSNVLADSSTGKAGPAAGAVSSNYDLFVWNDSGTVRLTRGPAWTSATARGTGSGTTEIARVNGIHLNEQSITNGPAAQRGTYVGTIRTNASSQVDMRFSDVDIASAVATVGVWNMYHRVELLSRIIHNGGGTHTYSTSGWRQYGGLANAQINFVTGLAEDSVKVALGAGISNTATGDHFVGVQIDATTGARLPYVRGLTNSKLVGVGLSNAMPPQLGYHYIAVNEIANVAGQAATVYQSLFSLAAVLRA